MSIPFDKNRQIGRYSSDCHMEKSNFTSKFLRFAKVFLAVFIISSLIIASFSPEIMARSKKSHRSASSGSKKKSSTARSASGRGGKNAGKTTAKKKSSAARSASGKSGLRSASGTSGLKSTSSSSAGRKRASATSRNSKRASRISVAAGTNSMGGTAKKIGTPCQFNKAIWKETDDSGNALYYSAKTKMCDMPDNSQEISWTEAVSSEIKKAAWIKKNEQDSSGEVIYFGCEDGFIAQGKGIKQTCINPDSICPINTFIELVSKGQYMSLETGEECSLATNVSAKKASTEEAEDWGYESNTNLYKIGCKAGYYSKNPSSSMDLNSHTECVKCEEGYTSQWGATGCSEICKTNEMTDKVGRCQPCHENSTFKEGICVCNPGYVGDGINCNPCTAGSYCTGGTYEDGTLKICPENTFSLQGSSVCKSCPSGSTASLNRNTCICSGNSRYRASDNTCVNTQCGEGEIFKEDTLTCETCPAGTKATTNLSGVEICETCPAGTYSNAGSSTCSACPDYHWSDAGSSKCNPILVKITYSYWADDSEANRSCSKATSKWFKASQKIVNCNNSTFGDPAYGFHKSCGATCAHITGENKQVNINCPNMNHCYVTGSSRDREIQLKADGYYRTRGKSWGNTDWRDQTNGGIMVKWDGSSV